MHPKLGAQMVEASAAVRVVEWHDERLDRNSVTLSDPTHLAANVDNLRGKLMAENLRQHCAGELVRSRGGDDRAAREFMQVSAADAASARFNENLAVPERVWRPNLFDAYVLLGVEPHRFHGFLPFQFAVSVERRGQRDDALSARRRDGAGEPQPAVTTVLTLRARSSDVSNRRADRRLNRSVA